MGSKVYVKACCWAASVPRSTGNRRMRAVSQMHQLLGYSPQARSTSFSARRSSSLLIGSFASGSVCPPTPGLCAAFRALCWPWLLLLSTPAGAAWWMPVAACDKPPGEPPVRTHSGPSLLPPARQNAALSCSSASPRTTAPTASTVSCWIRGGLQSSGQSGRQDRPSDAMTASWHQDSGVCRLFCAQRHG